MALSVGNSIEFSAEGSIKHLFEIQERLYSYGARNFLFLDVPPRMPFRNQGPPAEQHQRMVDWRDQLRIQSIAFTQLHPDARCRTFSAYDLFTRILEQPMMYGFGQQDPYYASGGIWVDGLQYVSSLLYEHRAQLYPLAVQQLLCTILSPKKSKLS